MKIEFTSSFEPGKYLCPRSYEIYYDKGPCGDGTAKYPRKLPKSWTFEGSNDGETWTALDTHENWNDWSAYTWSSFSFNTVECYRHYRLHMTAICNTDANNQYYTISELRINGEIYDSPDDPKRIRTWTGASSSDWSDAANWTPGVSGESAPEAGDAVVIKGANVTLSSSTPALAALELSGTATLTMTNWATCLTATNVTVASGATLTCGAASTNRAAISRVWIACENLTVESGGKIDVSSRGWSSFPIASSTYGYRAGFGPGRYAGYRPGGAPSHGGFGSHIPSEDYGGVAPLPYDDPSDPTEPGSSGTTSQWAVGGNGGGVVRIEATGLVTVNGSILADGRNSSGYGGYGWKQFTDNHDSSGSGGAVNIVCRSLAGSGTISAKGGGGGDPTASIPGMPAGGGMIALRYETSAQTAAAVSGLNVSAAAGLCKRGNQNDSGTVWRTTSNVNADDKRYNADIGTVWMSDGKILDATLGATFCGQVRGVSAYVREGDLDFTSGHVRFAEEGACVTVNGNLTLGGTDARLEIGGSQATNISAYADIRAFEPCQLTVAGDLTLGGVSRLDVRAAERSSADAFGAFVTVGGTLTVSTNCFVYAWSDVTAWGSPKFTVGGLCVATGGVFSADRRGGLGGAGGNTTPAGHGHPSGCGPGAGKSGQAGGGHGGNGGLCTSYNGGYAYDDAYRPFQAGSGGCAAYTYTIGGYGGGLVYVSAPKGTIRIDGTVTANGEDGVWGNGFGGGGSGGAIFLEAKRFFGGETALLAADGGETMPRSNVSSGGGGGGRIAVWCGEPWEAKLSQRRIVKSVEPLTQFPEDFQFDGSAQATGGALQGTASGKPGADGTVWFCRVNPPAGFVLTLR